MSQWLVHSAPYWAHRSAAFIIDVLEHRLTDSDRRVFVALAGGSTPAAVYEYWSLLAPATFDWSRIHLFLSDERMVPLSHADSNYRMAREKLPNAVHLYAVDTALPPGPAALKYQDLIQRELSQGAGGALPSFDLILLGVGTDGHTASLFPGSEALMERKALVAPATQPESGQARVTFTLPLISAAFQVVFLVAGSSKKEILQRLKSEADDCDLPAAQAAREDRQAIWLVDDAAMPDFAA